MTKSELKEIVRECVEEIKLEEGFNFEEATQIYIEAVMNNELLEEEVDVLEEGANMDSRKIFNEAKAKMKAAIKTAKKETKAKNYDAAHKAVAEAKAAVKEAEKGIREIDSSAGSAIYGYFAYGLLNFGELLLPYSVAVAGSMAGSAAAASGSIAGTAVGGALAVGGNIAMTVKSIVSFIKDLKTFVKTIDEDKKANLADKLNLYKTKLLRYTSDMQKILNNLDKSIDQRAKNDAVAKK